MKEATELLVSLAGGRRVDVAVGPHVVHTDQPISNGREGTAPSPFEVFLASVGACAGVFIQGFCAQRGIPTAGVRIVERATFVQSGALGAVELEIQLPPDFPDKYRDAVIRVVDQCSVKRASSQRADQPPCLKAP